MRNYAELCGIMRENYAELCIIMHLVVGLPFAAAKRGCRVEGQQTFVVQERGCSVEGMWRGAADRRGGREGLLQRGS